MTAKYMVKMDFERTRSWVYKKFFFIWWNVHYNNGTNPRQAIEIYEESKVKHYVG